MATEAAPTQSIASADVDTDLVRRLRLADQGAYAHFCRRFGPALHGFAASRLSGDHDLAEDIMIQTLASAVRNIGRFNPRKATLLAWLYGIARRQIQAEIRRQKRRKSVPAHAQVPIDTINEVPSAGDMAADLAARVDAQRKIADLSRFLSDSEMEVLTLHWVDEFSAREIARIVGRSHRAVESLLHRARQKALERWGDHAG
ncbi:MAG: RNA polymerase sigma factor [Armatimonadota bacterium]|nr:MAG: RNA polymerase sigma factor [Armatimonadota bacterium]